MARPPRSFRRNASPIPGSPELQVEKFLGVLEQNLWSHLWLNTYLIELLHPSFHGERRPVRAEHDLVLDDGVDVLHELRRKILRRPARKVDVDIGFVPGNGEALRLPGPRWMGGDDLELRKIGGHLVYVNGLGI